MGNAQLLRRLRRFAPYPLIGVAVYWLHPFEAFGSDAADQILDWAGLLVAFSGEALRFWTWGTNAVAGMFTLRASGPYKLLRHPLYVGNFLIVLGMLMIYNNPVAYYLGVPAFAILYHVVTRREEDQLLSSADLGPPYAEYMRVHRNRFLPQLEHWRSAAEPAHPFRWWYAAEKEYEGIIGVLLGWIALDVYEEQSVWRGASHGDVLPLVQIGVVVAIALAAPVLYVMKKRRARSLRAEQASADATTRR